jgi:hypothetical protein
LDGISQLKLTMDYGPEIDAALSSQDLIPKDTVLLWIDSVTDLQDLAKIYRITGEGYYRIQPELGKEAECRAVRNYLLECVRQDVSGSEEFQSRWEAARTLHLWLRQLLKMGDASDEIENAARAITDLFLTSGEEIQLAIEQGFLEHALESAALRPYFEHWSKDARLRETWLAATAWADDHPDWSWNLHQELLRKIADK